MFDDHQHAQDPLQQYLKPYHLPNTLKPHQVDEDSKLREYVTKTLNTDFKPGHTCTYYEFTNEMENILEGKEVLLQDETTKEWFQPKEFPADAPKLFGEGIPRNRFGERYKVYIQSFGSGGRHLPGGTSILYNHGEQVISA
jgi:hypothetical protein